MIVSTDFGAIRLAAPLPEQTEVTESERVWVAFLRETHGGTTQPPTLAVLQVIRRAMRAGR